MSSSIPLLQELARCFHRADPASCSYQSFLFHAPLLALRLLNTAENENLNFVLRCVLRLLCHVPVATEFKKLGLESRLLVIIADHADSQSTVSLANEALIRLEIAPARHLVRFCEHPVPCHCDYCELPSEDEPDNYLNCTLEVEMSTPFSEARCFPCGDLCVCLDTTNWAFATRGSQPKGPGTQHCFSLCDPPPVDGIAGGSIASNLWPAEVVLSRLLCRSGLTDLRGVSVLELGAGHGLAGLLCKQLGASRVMLTDYNFNSIQHLKWNIAKFYGMHPTTEPAALRCAFLDWGNLPPPSSFAPTDFAPILPARAAEPPAAMDLPRWETLPPPEEDKRYDAPFDPLAVNQPDLIVASDVVYLPSHVPLLMQALKRYLRPRNGLAVIVLTRHLSRPGVDAFLEEIRSPAHGFDATILELPPHLMDHQLILENTKKDMGCVLVMLRRE
ncbi:hypothetical protein PAPYR_8081 [Paratrimastix pyriformis]|uniref:Uncharacterized protein n=1 Tax=Paratrimastix pyriformis TaxID=342808 RepID=A0ABQ8UFY7_9EUKA|nr:hypothetical protein PAPYR_8081 [Paratrimastix pyriformis]